MNGTQHPASETSGRAGDQRAHRGLVQAPVRPLDEDGVTATIVGTVLFAIASIVMLCLRPHLRDHGDGWWLWVCVTGTALGLIGQVYCRRRAARQG